MFEDDLKRIERPGRPWFRNWLLWVAGSLIVALVSVLFQFWLSSGNTPEPDQGGGVRLRAVGFGGASNRVRIEGNVPPEQQNIRLDARGFNASNDLEIKGPKDSGKEVRIVVPAKGQ